MAARNFLDTSMVCLGLGIDGVDIGFFFIDLERYANAARGAGDRFFSEMVPNFRIRATQPLCISVVYNELYVFYPSKSSTELYKIYLPPLYSMSEVRFDKDNLGESHDTLASKVEPQSVHWYTPNGIAIIIFSTKIRFSDKDTDKDRVDFECYHPHFSHLCMKFPQLHVCPSDRTVNRPFFKFGSDTDTIDDEFPIYSRVDIGSNVDFKIVSFTVDGDYFKIMTDFGRVFSLRIGGGGENEWALCDDDDQPFSLNENFVIDGVYINASGVTSVNPQRFVPFPTPSIGDLQLGRGYYSSAYTLLDARMICSTCRVQLAYDSSSILVGGSSRLYWIIDVFKINLMTLRSGGDGGDEKEYKKAVNRIMNLKFCLKDDRWISPSHIVGLFPLRWAW